MDTRSPHLEAELEAFWAYWLEKFDDPGRWFYEGWRHDAEIEGYRGLFEAVDARDIAVGSITERILSLIVLDQLPRHLFRGSGEAYARDARARAAARRFYDEGAHRRLDMWTFIFWTTIFEHSEDLEDHALARGLLIERIEQTPDDSADRRHLDEALLYLDRHSDVLRRFGRYPKRVEVRGEHLTEAEATYLEGRVGKPY